MTRILHFTDMHLRHHQPGSARQPERLSREMPSALDRLAEKAKALAPDVVVLTGDVLDVPDDVIEGEPADGRALADWHAEVEADFRMVRDWFDATGIPYVVIPGNHDDEAIFRRVFPESTPIIDKAGIRFFCFWDDLSPERQPRRTGERRDLFDAALNAAEHARPQVHVQHYTIVPEIESRGWRYDYIGASGMKQSLDASDRVRAVLSGHYHPGSLVEDGGVVYSGVPAFCEAPFPFRTYDIEDGRDVSVADHSLD